MNCSELFSRYKHYFLLLSIFIGSVLLFVVASMLHTDFDKIMSVVSYLTWHNLFEFSSILVCFGVFVVAYYTYEQTRNYRSLFLASVFLCIGIIDFFHTLSFKGMPDFFINNTSANRATTLWIASRLLGALGLVIVSHLPFQMVTKIKKQFFLLISLVICSGIFIMVTYYPALIPPMYIEDSGLTPLKINLEYIIVALFALTMVKFILGYQKTKQSSDILFAGAMLLNIFSEFAFISYGSVYDIYNYIGHVYKVISFFIIFRITFIHDVQIPYFELYKARNQLKQHADNLDKMVEQRTLELKRMNEKLLEDLEYARDIQKSMLPLRLPDEPEVGFDARYFPAERVSGDFYNVFRLDERNIGIYIGDVSGHGVSAAMLTVFINQTIKTVWGEEEGNTNIFKPSDVLNNLYKSFNKTNFKEEVYIVLLYGVLNLDTKAFTYASAGMNVQPLVLEAQSGEVKELGIKGFPICKFMEFYSGDYKDHNIQLNSGDRILFYTDGLLEAENREGEIFSQARLSRILEKSKEQDGAALSEIIIREVFSFIEYKEFKDDLTFVIMQVK